MNKFTQYFVLAVAVCSIADVASAAENPQKPGKWQVTMQMDMPNMPFEMPPITINVCLTEDDVKDPQKAVPSDPKSSCKVGEYSIDGNTVSWSVDCPKEQMQGRGEITFTENTYAGAMTMTTGDQEIKTKYSGKWLGECTK